MTNQHEPASPDPTLRPARLALYFGVGSIVIGLVALWAGYNGAATNPIVEAQVPYLISGGLAGLGFLLLGAVGIAASVILTVTGEIRRELHANLEALSRGVAEGKPSPVERYTPDPLPKAATNGSSVLVSSAGSSFHRADCRLVERAEAVSKVGRSDAAAQGLQPCRVCNP